MRLTLGQWIQVAVVLSRLLFLVSASLLAAKMLGGLMLSGAMTLYVSGHTTSAAIFVGLPFVYLAWRLVAWIRQNLKQQAEDRLGIDWRKTG